VIVIKLVRRNNGVPTIKLAIRNGHETKMVSIADPTCAVIGSPSLVVKLTPRTLSASGKGCAPAA
jgi:hypothetical protein